MEETFKFTEWVEENYIKFHGGWLHRYSPQFPLSEGSLKTTEELFEEWKTNTGGILGEKYDLREWFVNQLGEAEDEKGYMHKVFVPFVTKLEKEEVVMLFNGVELILNFGGTYILNDTTGG